MREILFRGKSVNGYWIYGNLNFYPDINRTFIRKNNKELLPSFQTSLEEEVNKNSIGQYTGLTDKNGKKIFEGDIVDVEYKTDYVGVAKERIGRFEVVFHNGCFMKDKIEGCGLYHFINTDEHTVIGNIHDNPELLKGREGK